MIYRMMFWVVVTVISVVMWSNEARAELVVIVHKSNPLNGVSADALDGYFKKAIKFWENGTMVDPVDLPDTHPLAVEFATTVMGLPTPLKQQFWTHKILSGGGTPPRQFQDESAVADYVATHPGAIGYVDRGDYGGRVKMITISGLRK